MKSEYSIRLGVKYEFDNILNQYHYLQSIEKRKYRTGINVILEKDNINASSVFSLLNRL